MPAGDGTGPLGFGPMTGRAAGYCAGYPIPGYMNPAAGAVRGFGLTPAAYAPGASYGPAYGAAYAPAPYARAWGRPFGGFGRGFGRRFGRGRGRGRGWFGFGW